MIINIRRGRAASEGIATSSGPVRWMSREWRETRPGWEPTELHAALKKPSPGNYHIAPLKYK